MLTKEAYPEQCYLTGQPIPPPVPKALKAGPLDMVYENGFLRYIKLNDFEILRMIYFAVRDFNWDTIPAQINNEEIITDLNSFKIFYTCRHVLEPTDFQWDVEITGTQEGEIIFTINGQALSTFKRNRIGFCVLHPIKENKGQPCLVTTPQGTQTTVHFPRYISPHQPIKAIRSMQWQVQEKCSVYLNFNGAVFETEDQRNWSDSSYKTYCTPLDLPFPVTVNKGDKVQQCIELSLRGTVPLSIDRDTSSAVRIKTLSSGPVPIPAVGVCRSSRQKRLSESELALLQKINLSHYRCDLDLSSSDWQQQFKRAIGEAGRLTAALETVLFLTSDHKNDLQAFISCCHKHKPDIRAITLHQKDKLVTPDDLITGAVPIMRKAFPGARIGAGTDAFFTELNRTRPNPDNLDYLTYSCNPQVHAFDSATLIENLAALGDTVQSAQQFAKGRHIHVSPLTLKRRFNPDTTGESHGDPNRLPEQVDPRQMSLFAAGWLVGSFKYLAEAGAGSLTYFEAVGMRGLFMGDEQNRFPDQFPAPEQMIFPLYHTLRMILDWRDARILPTDSDAPLAVTSLFMVKDKTSCLVLANHTRDAQTVETSFAPQGTLVRLDQSTMMAAMSNPDVLYDRQPELLNFDSGPSTILLQPYGIVFVSARNA